MNEQERFITIKKIIWFVTAVLALVIFLVCSRVAAYLCSTMPDQLQAKRWGDGKSGFAQVSAFFAVGTDLSDMSFKQLEYQLSSSLSQQNIEVESENPSARLFISSYSGTGQISLSDQNTNAIRFNAIGVSGDFFQFHPQDLLSGGYFSGEDLNQDFVLLDEVAAWQLYGSSDIAGQVVFVGEKPLIIKGVFRVPEDELSKSAGLKSGMVFIPNDILEQFGVSYGINCYEICMPNPVKGFALSEMQKQLESGLGIDPNKMEVLENSARFDLLKRYEIVKNYSSRVMNGKAIIFPYWENIARGMENRVSLWTMVGTAALVYSLGVLFVLIALLWRYIGVGDRVGGFFHGIPDFLYNLGAKRHQRKLQRKEKGKN